MAAGCVPQGKRCTDYIMTKLVWWAELWLHGVPVTCRMYKPSSQKKLTAMLDTINKQYKSLNTHHTPALAPGQHSTSSIHRQYIYSILWAEDFAQWAVPCSWASAPIVGCHTSLYAHSTEKKRLF